MKKLFETGILWREEQKLGFEHVRRYWQKVTRVCKWRFIAKTT
jgi:hypothetical protein